MVVTNILTRIPWQHVLFSRISSHFPHMLHLRLQENVFPMDVVQTLPTASLLWRWPYPINSLLKKKKKTKNLRLLTIWGKEEGNQQCPGSQGPDGLCMSSLPERGPTHYCTGKALCNGNVHTENIYMQTAFVGCLSYLIFSKTSILILS